MSEYEIWSEGYRINGCEAGATFHGLYLGENFLEACRAWAKSLSEEDRHHYNDGRVEFWGCRLFDNEEDARRSFG